MNYIINKILDIYKKNSLIEAQQEGILRYSLEVILYTIMAYIISLIVAGFLGILGVVAFMITFMGILRMFSGGAHFSSKQNCIFTSVLFSNTLGLLVKYTGFSYEFVYTFAIAVFIFALWSIMKYAPADTPQKPIKNPERRQKLKRSSLIIVCIWFTFVVYSFSTKSMKESVLASSFIILCQCFTLTKKGYLFYHKIDLILNKFKLQKAKGGVGQ